MNPTEFIRKNITDRLLAENFTLSVAQSAANEGVKYYLKATGATVRGGYSMTVSSMLKHGLRSFQKLINLLSKKKPARRWVGEQKKTI